MHALAWRVFHSFGLGLLLRAQSKSKWLVRHFLKHYHYHSHGGGHHGGVPGRDLSGEKEEVVQAATEEAFNNWKVTYNISLVMTYGEFAWRGWCCSTWLHADVTGLSLLHLFGLEDLPHSERLDR
jgi:phosphatidylethanolamine N-methyltransferase